MVITGMGTVNPLGNDVASSWNAALKGVSGIALIESFPTAEQPVKFAGQLKGFNPESALERKEIRRTDRFVQLAVAAAQEAVDDSGLGLGSDEREDVGVLIGSGVGGLGTLEANARILFERGPTRISPFFVPAMTANMASGAVSLRFKALGPNSGK